MSERLVVALVGHCVPDSALLKRAVDRALPGAEVRRVNDEGQLAATLAEADLLLVNRALDGEFTHRTGVELIRVWAPRRGAAALMLISNHADAQQAAEAAGATPGFGKAEVGSDEARDRIRAAVGARAPAR